MDFLVSAINKEIQNPVLTTDVKVWGRRLVPLGASTGIAAITLYVGLPGLIACVLAIITNCATVSLLKRSISKSNYDEIHRNIANLKDDINKFKEADKYYRAKYEKEIQEMNNKVDELSHCNRDLHRRLNILKEREHILNERDQYMSDRLENVRSELEYERNNSKKLAEQEQQVNELKYELAYIKRFK